MTKPDHFYQVHVFCCINKRDPESAIGCCASKRSEQLMAYMKLKMKNSGIPKSRVNGSLCLNRCALGPVMVIYPDGIWYHYNNEKDIDEIIDSIKKDVIVERLLLSSDSN